MTIYAGEVHDSPNQDLPFVAVIKDESGKVIGEYPVRTVADGEAKIVEVLKGMEGKAPSASQKAEFHSIDGSDGLARELAAGITTRIFAGEGAMLSVVTIAPGAVGTMHHHPEEQWGLLLSGTAIRFQGDEEIAVKAGDFWRTPGGVPHTMRAGPDGAKVLDVFAPPRPEYRVPGKGFGPAKA